MIKERERDEGQRLRRRRLVTLWGSLSIGVGCLLAVLWSAFGPTDVRAESNPETARLEGVAMRKRAETEASGNRLRQHVVGEGYRFDEQGNLLGAPPSSEDLVPNKSLDEISGRPADAGGAAVAGQVQDKVLALTKEVEAAAQVQDAEDEPNDGPLQSAVEVERRPKRGRARGGADGPKDDEFGGRTALAYSTVAGAAWARRRPDVGSGSDGRKGGVPSAAHEEGGPSGGDAMDRLALAAEQALRSTPGAGAAGPMIVGHGVGSGGPAGSGASLYSTEDGLRALRGARRAGQGEIGDMTLDGQGPVPSTVVRQGKFLDCVLTHDLRSDLVESPVTAMVSRDFITLDQQYVLIPAGSKLIGSAGRVQNVQQSRVYIRFERIIFPDQRTAWFPHRDVPALDAGGAIGVDGDVDRHFWLQFGSAIVLGVLDGLGAAVQARGGADPNLQALVTARTSSNLANVLAGIIGRYGNVVPTVTVPAGSKLKVYFAEDVQLSPYMPTTDLSYLRGSR